MDNTLSVPAPKRRSSLGKLSPSFRVGGVIVLLVVLAALASLARPLQDPNRANFGKQFAPPSAEFWLGTDQLGRDLASRLLAGAHNALYVGLIAVGIGLVLGSLLGILAGYLGGWLDQIVMLGLEALYALPALLLALLLAAVFGPGAFSSMVAIGVAAVPAFARLARAGVLAVKAQPYVEAAQALGATSARIMFRHVLPNILGPLVVQASLAFAGAILAEAALSYLGLGTQPPTASWGRMLREAQSYLAAGLSPYPSIWPGLAIALTVLGFNLMGDGLRDRLDPRAKT